MLPREMFPSELMVALRSKPKSAKNPNGRQRLANLHGQKKPPLNGQRPNRLNIFYKKSVCMKAYTTTSYGHGQL